MDWISLYPDHFSTDQDGGKNSEKVVEFVDVGCGYGGLLGKGFFNFFHLRITNCFHIIFYYLFYISYTVVDVSRDSYFGNGNQDQGVRLCYGSNCSFENTVYWEI